jgi:hypothetical protein
MHQEVCLGLAGDLGQAPPDLPKGLAADPPREWSYEPVRDELPVPDPVMA